MKYSKCCTGVLYSVEISNKEFDDIVNTTDSTIEIEVIESLAKHLNIANVSADVINVDDLPGHHIFHVIVEK